MTRSINSFSEQVGKVNSQPTFFTQCVAVAMLSFATLGLLAGGWKILSLIVAASTALALTSYVIYSIVKGDCDRILIGWVFLFPLGYYYLSYPRTAPIIQFDRTVVLALLGCILFTPKLRTWSVARDMKRAALAWALVVVATFISFFQMPEVFQNTPPALTIGRLIVEAFVLPAVMGWYVLRQFDLRRYAKSLHIAVCLFSLYSVALGIGDVILQRHVLTYDFSGYYWAYDPTDPTEWAFLRPSGPFTTSGSFGLIGLISFFVMAFLWSLIRNKVGKLHSALHIAGMAAAILQPLLTLNRATYLTIVICAFIGMFWTTGYRRVLNLVGVGLIILAVIGVAILAPGVFKERSSSSDVFGRVAENEQSWDVFIDHPLVGVGLQNFTPIVENTPRYQTSRYMGVGVVNFPHNNIAWIAAEMGVVGVVPYLASQVLLVMAFWRLRKSGDRGEQAWRYFVYVFISYWIPAFTWTSGQSGDLNIWFMFSLCLFYRYVAQETSEGAALPASIQM